MGKGPTFAFDESHSLPQQHRLGGWSRSVATIPVCSSRETFLLASELCLYLEDIVWPGSLVFFSLRNRGVTQRRSCTYANIGRGYNVSVSVQVKSNRK